MPVDADRLERAAKLRREVADEREGRQDPERDEPEVTCRPWNPVRVKNVEANRLLLTVTPLRRASGTRSPARR